MHVYVSIIGEASPGISFIHVPRLLGGGKKSLVSVACTHILIQVMRKVIAYCLLFHSWPAHTKVPTSLACFILI